MISFAQHLRLPLLKILILDSLLPFLLLLGWRRLLPTVYNVDDAPEARPLDTGINNHTSCLPGDGLVSTLLTKAPDCGEIHHVPWSATPCGSPGLTADHDASATGCADQLCRIADQVASCSTLAQQALTVANLKANTPLNRLRQCLEFEVVAKALRQIQ